MTRESIPRFDLYAELEVSRQASVEVIEAVYRTLAKRHHPDVARPQDMDRIKRLNQAREWLTDPARRRRYDAATRRETPRPSTPNASTGPTGAETAPEPAAGSSARKSSPKAFGINTAEVRQFLADLRALDETRAIEVRGGKAAADAIGYAAARHAAFTSARGQRAGEWLLAREAASVIARGKLGDSPLRAEIPDVVADIAGAIAIRDLIPRADFELLLLPWTWRDERVPTPAPVRRRSTTVAAGHAAPARVRAGRRLMTAPAASVAALVAVVAVTGLWGTIASMNGPQGAGADDASGQGSANGTAAALPSEPSSPGPSPDATASPAPSPTIDPARLHELQLGARTTIRELMAAAETGNVKAAQAVLGDSAPNLDVSGLRRATFPNTAASDILVAWTGGQWVATAATDRLVSSDGSHWTFDYADRPLAHFLGRPEHDLYWLEPDGRHDLYLRVVSATLSRSGLSVEVAWRFGSGNDTYFRRADLVVSSVVFGSIPMAMTADPIAVLGTSGGQLTAAISSAVGASPSVQVDIAASNGRADTGLRTVVTTFVLRRG